jgi:chemotaxis protein methyltransferase CheR
MTENYSLSASNSKSCDRICVWLNSHCGIHFPESKKDLIAHRLSRVVDKYQLGSMEKLAFQVESGGPHELLLAVMDAASTNHTYFFREPQVLNFFRDTILPSLEYQNDIRIWSAAASTGDEAYTIAIIAAERWGVFQACKRMAILGTDISEPVINQAEEGVYGSMHLDHVPDSVLQRYFRPCGIGQHAIQDDIRKMCTFRRLNLKACPYPFRRAFDIIFCRNVLYYFDRDHQTMTLEGLYEVAKPGGWLLTSVTETVRDLHTRWVSLGSGIHRKLP